MRYVRRPKGARYDVRYQVPTVKHGGGSVMVWGCFSRDFKGPIVRINGIMDRFLYRDILQQNLVPFGNDAFDGDFVFQQDNDPKHSSKLLKEFFVEAGINVMQWPSQSPDLNPIENLWSEVEKRLRAKRYRNTDELFEGIQAAWEAIPLDFCQKLVDSMGRRCQAVRKAKGFATKY